MRTEDFEKVFSKRIEKLQQLISTKSKEYVRNGDRLHNFNVGANITNSSRERALDGMLLKHYISYRDMLDDIDKGKIPTPEYVDEKIGDIITYFCLQEAAMLQTIKEDRSKRTMTAKTTN